VNVDVLLPAGWAAGAGLWVGFVFTLLIFSALLGDHLLARLAQYVLVGALLGYTVVVTWQSILASTWVAALHAEPWTPRWQWAPAAAAAILAVAGLGRILAQSGLRPPASRWLEALRLFGALPALGLAAVAAALALTGSIQGTLGPQFLHAARNGLIWGAPWAMLASNLVALLVTAAALVALVTDPAQHLTSQPAWVQRLLRGWIWLGQRALWLAAGALFARLFASRLSLWVAEITYWTQAIQSTELGQQLERGWRLWMGR
jgi:xanthosine utilization system XapX-like protein